MRIVYIDLEKPLKAKNPIAACIGYFDGMHRGHQALIEETKKLAKEHNCGSALITFDPDPWVTIHGIDKSEVEHLTTMRQKINLAVAYGIENIYILKFTPEMSQLSPDDFIQYVLGQLNLKALICGFDFRYGKNGAGRPDVLKYQVVYPVVIVDEVKEGGEKISSTRISALIKDGRMEEAVAMLGHPFEVEGKVIEGRHLGTDLGFPTANIEIDPEYLIPKTGVYAAFVKCGFDLYKSMVNIGHNPTLNYYKNISLEAHLINFSGDLYGKTITVKLLKYIRPETQFRTRENLIMQLELDYKAITNYLSQFPESFL